MPLCALFGCNNAADERLSKNTCAVNNVLLVRSKCIWTKGFSPVKAENLRETVSPGARGMLSEELTVMVVGKEAMGGAKVRDGEPLTAPRGVTVGIDEASTVLTFRTARAGQGGSSAIKNRRKEKTAQVPCSQKGRAR